MISYFYPKKVLTTGESCVIAFKRMNHFKLNGIGAFVLAVIIASTSTTMATELKATHANIIFEAESPYQTIYVTRQDGIMSLRNGSRFARSTFMDIEDPYRHVFEYSGLMMMALAYREPPKNALIIGMGGGTISKYLKKYYPDLEIINVEMDPVVVDVAKRFFNFVETPSNRIVVMDGRRFLRRSGEKYDLIFLDAYYGGYIPFHLLTEEFLILVRDHLSDEGVVASHTRSTQELYERESATWATVFGHFDSFLGRRSAARVAIATKTGRRHAPEELVARMQTTQEQQAFREIDLVGMAETTLNRRLSWPDDTPLLTDDYAPVNLLMDPRDGLGQ